MRRWIAVIIAVVASFSQTAFAAAWPDTIQGRRDVQALIEQLNGALLASPSATTTLESWCADHHMASPARLVALRDLHAIRPLAPADRTVLAIGPNEPVVYRRVNLACGDHVLSQAENWYVPARLTPAMNRALATSDTPFGKVIRDLKPTRHTLSVERLWSPPRPDMHRPATGRISVPAALFRHRAVVYDGRRRPLALVIETYTGEILDFPAGP